MSNNNEISETMYLALDHQFNSELLNAKSSVLVYFNNAVGIGEHPQHLEEMDKLIDTMASAQDKLDILHKHFSKYKKIINEPDIRRASP
jgi:hypothetical protein